MRRLFIILMLLLSISAYGSLKDIRFLNSGYILHAKYIPQLIDFSRSHDIRIETLQNWIMAESSGREKAYNKRSKDYGLCQLHDVDYLTDKYWHGKEKFNIWNGEHNLYIGLAYLSDLISELGIYYGFIAYNIGQGRVKRGNILNCGIEYVNRILPERELQSARLQIFITLDLKYILIFQEQVLFDDRKKLTGIFIL